VLNRNYLDSQDSSACGTVSASPVSVSLTEGHVQQRRDEHDITFKKGKTCLPRLQFDAVM